jgi:acyl carrier protein|tara:strand:- start:2641 stop:2922 length:282 start_codon:yes stop_codon:yes gene_type:complete
MKKDERLNLWEKNINGIIDAVMTEEGYRYYDEIDSLTAMCILGDVEDYLGINIDLNVLEGITQKSDLVERFINEMTNLGPQPYFAYPNQLKSS